MPPREAKVRAAAKITEQLRPAKRRKVEPEEKQTEEVHDGSKWAFSAKLLIQSPMKPAYRFNVMFNETDAMNARANAFVYLYQSLRNHIYAQSKQVAPPIGIWDILDSWYEMKEEAYERLPPNTRVMGSIDEHHNGKSRCQFGDQYFVPDNQAELKEKKELPMYGYVIQMEIVNSRGQTEKWMSNDFGFHHRRAQGAADIQMLALGELDTKINGPDANTTRKMKDQGGNTLDIWTELSYLFREKPEFAGGKVAITLIEMKKDDSVASGWGFPVVLWAVDSDEVATD